MIPQRKYTITYNANGGEGAPQREDDLTGEYIITSEAPTREGYGFAGWSIDPNADTATYHAGDTITLSVVIDILFRPVTGLVSHIFCDII